MNGWQQFKLRDMLAAILLIGMSLSLFYYVQSKYVRVSPLLLLDLILHLTCVPLLAMWMVRPRAPGALVRFGALPFWFMDTATIILFGYGVDVRSEAWFGYAILVLAALGCVTLVVLIAKYRRVSGRGVETALAIISQLVLMWYFGLWLVLRLTAY